MSLRILGLLWPRRWRSLPHAPKKVNNPLAKVDSKQPDKVLLRPWDGCDEAQSLRHRAPRHADPDQHVPGFRVRCPRQTVPGPTPGMPKAGLRRWPRPNREYEDFDTFFPNMPEAAEAQVKIANIHYQQMEKPDRHFTHAVRAEAGISQGDQHYSGQPEDG